MNLSINYAAVLLSILSIIPGDDDIREQLADVGLASSMSAALSPSSKPAASTEKVAKPLPQPQPANVVNFRKAWVSSLGEAASALVLCEQSLSDRSSEGDGGGR